MNPNPAKPHWLDSLDQGSHACFFYTTDDEFFAIALPFLKEGLEHSRDRLLWILPPNVSFAKAKQGLSERLQNDLEPHLRRRRLIMIPWEKWYGTEQSIQNLLKRGQQFLKEANNDGFEGLRILSHSPHRTSSYWKDFFLYEESFPKRFKGKPFVSLCAYSLIDCPAQAISSIARNHSLCLIHRGSEWEWLLNKPFKPVAFPDQL